jgi:hypothetical protein
VDNFVEKLGARSALYDSMKKIPEIFQNTLN